MNRCRMLVVTGLLVTVATFTWRPGQGWAQSGVDTGGAAVTIQSQAADNSDVTFSKSRAVMRRTNSSDRKAAAKRNAKRQAVHKQKVKGGAVL